MVRSPSANRSGSSPINSETSIDACRGDGLEIPRIRHLDATCLASPARAVVALLTRQGRSAVVDTVQYISPHMESEVTMPAAERLKTEFGYPVTELPSDERPNSVWR